MKRFNDGMSYLSGSDFKEQVNDSQWTNMFFDWITSKSAKFPPSGVKPITVFPDVKGDHDCGASAEDGCAGCGKEVE